MQNRHYLFIVATAAVAVLFVGASKIRASEPSQATGAPNRLIRVSGTAVVYGKPDYATIALGVTKLAPKVLDAKSACDAAMQRVQAALRKSGISQDDIQTINYQIYPVQEKPSLPRQWKVVNQISIKVRKVSAVAPTIDAAIENGATDVSQIEFAIEKVLDLRSKARAEAVRVARGKAEELAKLNGVILGDPVTISDNTYDSASYAQTANSYGAYEPFATPGTTVSGGQMAVNARADLEFAIR
jgi:uncharacterized protein YggE